MWTIKYKEQYYINGYCDKDKCIVVFIPKDFTDSWCKECKILHAAKLAITKHIKENAK